MKLRIILNVAIVATVLCACVDDKSEKTNETSEVKTTETFNYNVEQFADLKILRYQIPGWEQLTLKEQKLVYYLTQAGLSGRDIMWDQNYRHNLTIRKALENIYTSYKGDKTSDNWKAFEVYLKRVWFSNGIHHHYSNDKIETRIFNSDYLKEIINRNNKHSFKRRSV